MTKNFRAFLAENDQEYTYYIRSTRNIHEDEILDWVRLALLPYDLREIKKSTYKPPMAGDNGFELEPYAPVWVVRVKLGIEPADDEMAVQQISTFTHINDQYIIFHKEGEPAKRIDNDDQPTDKKPNDALDPLLQTAKNWDSDLDKQMIDPDAGQYVSNPRLADFIQELEKDRQERETWRKKYQLDPKLYESFVTSHLALRDVYGESPQKGFYIVERRAQDKEVMHIAGPLKHCPINYEFVPDLVKKGAGTFEVLSESEVKLVGSDRNFRFSRGPILQERVRKTYEVEVQDQDTGKTYTVAVKSFKEEDARDKAVQTVARQEKLDVDRLIATEPEAV